MRFSDSFRSVRACRLREVSRIHDDARRHRADLRGSALSHTLAASALIFGCSVLLAACGRGPQTAPAPAFIRQGQRLEIPAGSPLRQRLVVAPLALRAAPRWLQVPGVVEAEPTRLANVLPPLGGRVSAVKVEIGERVTRGQLLAVIDSGAMAQAYAAVATTHSALNLARQALSREQGVAKAGGAATKDVQAAQDAYAQALAAHQSAMTSLAALGGNAGTATPRPIEIRAPIGGSVTALSIAPGTFVNDPTASIMTIANLDKVWVTAQVPGDQLGLVAVGAAAKTNVPAWPDRAFRGKVASIGAVLNPDTRRDPVRIAIDNPDHALKPNMFANVEVAVQQPAEVFVPASALLMNNDRTTVFVEVAPWTFERRSVELGYDEGEGEGTRVLKGLVAGERVIVAGGVLLNDD